MSSGDGNVYDLRRMGMPPNMLLRVGAEAFEEDGWRMCGRCPHGLQKLVELPFVSIRLSPGLGQ